MIKDLINPKKIRRAIALAVYMLAALLVQEAILARIPILGVRALFWPAVCVSVGLFEGGAAGAVFGLFLGLFGDMSFPENAVLFTVMFPLIGFFSGAASRFYFTASFASYMLLSATALIVTALVQLVGAAMQSGAASGVLFGVAGLQVLWSLIPAALCYPVMRWLCGAFGSRSAGGKVQ